MSRIRANQITNQSADGAPTVQNGLVISGMTTSTTFSGSGASLTNLNASNIASGTVPTARLGSGTASSSTFLRGDSTFQTVNTDLVSDSSPQLGGDLDTNGSDINFGDSSGNGVNRLTFGTLSNGDLEIFHDGNNSYIQERGTGFLAIRGSDSVRIQDTDTADNMAIFNKNGAVPVSYTHLTLPTNREV